MKGWSFMLNNSHFEELNADKEVGKIKLRDDSHLTWRKIWMELRNTSDFNRLLRRIKVYSWS